MSAWCSWFAVMAIEGNPQRYSQSMTTSYPLASITRSQVTSSPLSSFVDASPADHHLTHPFPSMTPPWQPSVDDPAMFTPMSPPQSIRKNAI